MLHISMQSCKCYQMLILVKNSLATDSCEYFNFFSSHANPVLQKQCHLLDNCYTRKIARAGPVGPVLGRKDCSPTDYLLDHPRGGQWFWFDTKQARQARDVAIVHDDTKVIYFCGDKPLETAHCDAGEIVPRDKVFNCPCKALEESDDVQCDDVADVLGEVQAGTKCFKICGDKVMEEAFCDLGDWTADLSEVECFVDIEKEEVKKHKSWTWMILLVTSVFTLLGVLGFLCILRRGWRS